jgi:AraC-like DNA-binding protein
LNHAFKADTGMTPTDFRRDAIVRSASGPSASSQNLDIGQSG